MGLTDGTPALCGRTLQFYKFPPFQVVEYQSDDDGLAFSIAPRSFGLGQARSRNRGSSSVQEGELGTEEKV